jgi:glutathione S-transferase
MRLHTNPASPFGRKVKVLAREAGLIERIEPVDQALTPVSPNDAVVAANPLGKIPCLATDDDGGLALYDSRVICEYLDSLHDGPRLFPAEGPARWRALTLQALGDGIMDAGVGTRYESVLRPEGYRWGDWIDGQKLKIARGLDRLEELAENFGETVDVGVIAAACALGYLDFRFPEDRWRDGRPRLAAWFERFDARPSMQATRPRQP